MKKLLTSLFFLLLITITSCSAEEAPVEVVLKGENSVDLVVLVDEPNFAETEIATAFAKKLSEYTGKTVKIEEKSEYKGNAYTILVGAVKEDGSNLPSFDAHMSIEETDIMTWIDSAITTYDENYELIYGETSAQVIAPDEYWLYFALEDFLSGFKNETYSVTAGTRTLVGGNAVPTPAQLIEKVGDVKFLFTEYKATFVYYLYEADIPGNVLAVSDDQDGMQGGGTDGKYAYYALYNDDEAYIYKFDLETWELVDVSDLLPTGHSNDITYVPEKHVLMVADCTTKDDWKGVNYIDPDTLELIKYEILPAGSRGLQYIPETQQYIISGGYTHNVYDKDFNFIKSINCGFQRDTTQGIYSDGSYIYDARYGDTGESEDSGQNRILIHDFDGNFISEGIICDPVKNSENENVFIHNNLFYVGYYLGPDHSTRAVSEYVMVPVEMFE